MKLHNHLIIANLNKKRNIQQAINIILLILLIAQTVCFNQCHTINQPNKTAHKANMGSVFEVNE